MGNASLNELQHPKLDKGIIVLCIASAVLTGVFLESGGKTSWAEWSTIMLSFAVAGWIGLNCARIRKSSETTEAVPSSDPSTH